MNVPSFARRSAVAAVCGALALTAIESRASIVDIPPSIVDHGSYITDTVHGFDWYKFSNVDSTIGLSAEAALAHFAAMGWITATVAQVQSLEGQFGWTDDTPGAFSTANFGLTNAMAAFLGYTAQYTFDDGGTSETTRAIHGIASDVAFVDALSYHPVTASETYEGEIPNVGTYVYGDSVDGFGDWQQAGTGNGIYAVWLSRPTRGSADPGTGTNDVPEPGTWALMLAGIGAIVAERRRVVRLGRAS